MPAGTSGKKKVNLLPFSFYLDFENISIRFVLYVHIFLGGKWGQVSLSSTHFICLQSGRALQLCLKCSVQHCSAECILLMPSRTSQHVSNMMFTLCSNTFMNVSFQTIQFQKIQFSNVDKELITHLTAPNSSPTTCGLSFVNPIFVSVRSLASVPEFN